MEFRMEIIIFTSILLTCSCLAAPTNGSGGNKNSNGAQSEMTQETEEKGETLGTNEIPPPPGAEGQPSYLIHGNGPFQPPSPGTLKLYMPGMQKVMVPKVTAADFDFLDQNGNGLIDTTELAIGSNLPGFADYAFKISDIDNDGFVNLDEFFQFPMTWQRVIAEVRFQEAAHGGLTHNTHSPEMTFKPDVNGNQTPNDSQTEGNSLIANVSEGQDQAVSEVTEEGGAAELEAENEEQLVGTTASVGQVTETGGMSAEQEMGASAPAGSNGRINGQPSRGQIDVPKSQTDGEMQSVVEEEEGGSEPLTGIQDTQVDGASPGEVRTGYNAGQTVRYQSSSAPDSGPFDENGGVHQGQAESKQDRVKTSDTQSYYQSQHKASYYPAYPFKVMSGYIYAPHMKEAKPYENGFRYSPQSRRTGDSSEEERGGGSSSDEEDDERK